MKAYMDVYSFCLRRRLGWVVSLLGFGIAMIYGILGISIQWAHGHNVEVQQLLLKGSMAIVWICGGATAYAGAKTRDVAENMAVQRLFQLRGVENAKQQNLAEFLAHTLEILRKVIVPVAILVLLFLISSGSGHVFMVNSIQGLGAIFFVVGASLLLACLGWLCERAAGFQGGWLFVIVVLVPWLLSYDSVFRNISVVALVDGWASVVFGFTGRFGS